MRHPDELAVYRMSFRLAAHVIRSVRAFPDGTFPTEERYGLCQQMRRAAVSIMSNIAEGWTNAVVKALIALAKTLRA